MKVVILGNGGSGKTTLAKALQAHGRVADVIHMDLLRYGRDGKMRGEAAFREDLTARLDASPSWVCEGNYLSVLPERLQQSDLVILLDVPGIVCVTRIVKRQILLQGRRAEDLSYVNTFSRSFIPYVLSYRRKVLPRMREMLEEAGSDCPPVLVVGWPTFLRVAGAWG